MRLPEFYKNEITNDYLKSFLREKGVSNVSLNKNELFNELDQLLDIKKITEEEYWEFIAKSFKYGNNRIFLNSIINVPQASAIRSRESLERLLERKDEVLGNFNDFSNITDSNIFTEEKLIYQKINYSDDSVIGIERCYAKIIKLELTDEDGQPFINTIRVFNWVSLNLVYNRLSIHTKDYSTSNLQQTFTLKKTNNHYTELMKNIFNFTISESIHHKRTLYNIYKEMTDTAEKPFKEIIEPHTEKFTTFYKTMAGDLGYDISRDNIKLLNRITRLFERGLITQRFDLYKEYFEGKLGIIRRIVFSDNTGANVSAKVKDIDQNLSSYEIYFDTRDTLDEKKSIDKLWTLWFIKKTSSSIEKVEVKFEVYEEFYIIHFIGPFVLEGVAKHVFSKFRDFE